jgi:hypothetical protein
MGNKALTTRKKSSQGKLAITSGYVIYKLENNPAFPNPPNALAALKEILPEYQTALADALSRDKQKVAIKDKKKEIVVNLLNELADYVNAICKGNRTLLLSSGFDISENDTSLEPAIEKLEVILGESGEATTRIKKVTGAIAFVHEYATEPPGPNTAWTSRGSSLSRYTFTKLTSDKRHWFRAVAIGRGGKVGYSPIVTRVIQ